MKTSAASVLFLAAISGSMTIASPLPAEDLDGTSAPHNETGAAIDNPGVDSPGKDAAVVEGSSKCISFTSTNPNWHFANTGVWGSQTGTFGSGTKTICVPQNSGPGGAMFIGTTANPSAGNTKLECYFPTSGNANCDVSLVDGYSLSVTCKASKATIGGDVDLFHTGESCPDTSLIGQGICKNDHGYDPTQGTVPAFFQKGIQNGNKYCIWKNCAQDYYFPFNAAISCHVSGGR